MKLAILGVWHRRLGLLVLLAVVWLALSGMLLNHTSDFQLSERPLPLQLQQWFYKTESSVAGIIIHNNVWFQTIDGRLVKNNIELTSCNGELVSGVVAEDLMVLACTGDIILVLEDTGEVIERVGALQGMPEPIECMYSAQAQIHFLAMDQLWRFDTETMQWSAVANPDQLSDIQITDCETAAMRLSASVLRQQGVQGNAFLPPISWEQFVLDLHSGQIFGRLGQIIVDLMAVLLLLVSATGLWSWYKKRRLFE